MGNGDLGVIREIDINPPIEAAIENKRIKTNLFKEGEKYYLRNSETLRKGNASPNKNFLSYDAIIIELSVRFRFRKEEMKHEFKGTIIKIYHSHISEDNQFNFIGQTEKYKDDNLNYKKKFKMQYLFHKIQHVKLEIILNNNIQVVDTTLANIIGSRNMLVELPFYYKGTTDHSNVIVSGVVLKDEKKSSYVTFELLTEFPYLPFSDYFVIVSNWNNGNSANKVWKSHEITGKKFNFKASMVTMQDLCLGDYDQNITFEFYGVYSGKEGEVNMSLNQINKINEDSEEGLIDILNEKEEKIGFFHVNYSIEKISRFIDLIEKGLQISLTVCIDYTNSNSKDNNPSLHYIDPDGIALNQYETTITYIGDLIDKYDFYKNFACLGYGGIVVASEGVSHNFNVSLTAQAKVKGIEGVLEAYRKSLEKVQLDGPTYFAPVLKQSVQLIKENECESSIYHVILIITDGTIHDFDEVKSFVIKNSYLPYSIVIMGVGNEKFDKMNTLDADVMELEDKNGNKAGRDIIQFTRFLDYKDEPIKMAEDSLIRVPSQIEQYYRMYPFQQVNFEVDDPEANLENICGANKPLS